ncbi:hypothetical protein MMUR_47710 [Mycolicibacterium murale]|uniref:Uncharacterized protein n=1 Tax=Mycolicibacterium murale TaxID=182220 RepID=A0A7I9WSB1_9MYCO|nr:hypothetical protein MMUR_47710 [Mycolicibacterium murale]
MPSEAVSRLGEFAVRVSSFPLRVERTTCGTESAAIELALESVRRLRSEGAASRIRSVEVRRVDDCRPVFSASYFDPEQGLSDAEAYAARVCGWHLPRDILNANYMASNARWRAGDGPWPQEWGPLPETCPSCGRRI